MILTISIRQQWYADFDKYSFTKNILYLQIEDQLQVKKRGKRTRRTRKDFYSDYFHSIFVRNFLN
jgi:hypothetical protein